MRNRTRNWFYCSIQFVNDLNVFFFFNFVFLPRIGFMCAELHGEISKNEPKNIATFPRVPDFGQWKCIGNGTKSPREINTNEINI